MVNTFNSTDYTRETNGKGIIAAPGLRHEVQSRASTVAVSTAAGINDLLNFHHLPPGSKLVQAQLFSDGLDSGGGNASMSLDVGDADGAATIFSASTTVVAGGVDNSMVRAAIVKVYPVETLLQGKVHAAGHTKVAGNVTLVTRFKIEGNPTS